MVWEEHLVVLRSFQMWEGHKCGGEKSGPHLKCVWWGPLMLDAYLQVCNARLENQLNEYE